MAACWCHPRLCPVGTRCPDVPLAVPSCAKCPGVPPGSAQLFQVPRCPTGSAQLCSVQMLVPGQAPGLSVRRALHAQQRRQEASLPCEHTALPFMAKIAPRGVVHAGKAPSIAGQPMFIQRGGDTLPSPCPPALCTISLPERLLLDVIRQVPPGQNTQAGEGGKAKP